MHCPRLSGKSSGCSHPARLRAEYRERGVGSLSVQSLEVTLDKAGAGQGQRPRTRARARLRPKAQLTMPDEIRRALGVNEGDEVEFTVHQDGSITIRGYLSVPSDQAWFFTPERIAGKRQADADIAAGGGTVHGSGEAMFAHLADIGSTDDLLMRRT